MGENVLNSQSRPQSPLFFWSAPRTPSSVMRKREELWGRDWIAANQDRNLIAHGQSLCSVALAKRNAALGTRLRARKINPSGGSGAHVRMFAHFR